MNNITVSVIMLVYNHAAYICKAIESVLEQKCDFCFELIIGDDCSQDNSASIINDLSKKYDIIVPIIRKRNLGVTKNLLDLISKAKGKYVCFLEGDDFWIDPYKMKKQVDWLVTHPEQEGVAARYITSNEKGFLLRKRVFRENELITNQNFRNKGMPHIGTVMIRNPTLENEKSRKFHDLISLHNLIADYTIYLYIVDSSDFVILSDNVLNYRYVAKPCAHNYNSLIKYSLNRYNIIIRRIEYEKKLNAFHFNRIKLNFGLYEWAKEFCAFLLLDHGKNKKYGKNIFKIKIWPYLSNKEKILLPMGILSFFFSAFRKKIINIFYR